MERTLQEIDTRIRNLLQYVEDHQFGLTVDVMWEKFKSNELHLYGTLHPGLTYAHFCDVVAAYGEMQE
jgi:hypothetical protein